MSKRILLLFCVVMSFISGLKAQNNFWTDQPESNIQPGNSQRKIIPDKYRTLLLDTTGIKNLLRTVPKEFSQDAHSRQVILSIPMPYGGSQKFSVVETEVMEPGLQTMFPEIKVYGGQGIDDRSASIKIDIGPRGFHAAIRSGLNGSVYIDPYAQGLLTSFISYYKTDLTPNAPYIEEADPESSPVGGTSVTGRMDVFNGCIADTLRRYRLAVACTGEYGVAVGATSIAQALAAIVTSVNRVNGVYETELAIRLVLVDSNYKIVYINPATDFFTQNSSGSGLLTESIKICDSLIGSANYDIGHTFSTGAGGVAGLGVVCSASKARGVTGRANPTGDAYDIDYVAHEMGHQFGGNHTFNALTGSCNGNRSAAANAEPGSATTIMGYAGICGINNLQPNSDAYFHPVSYNEITNFTINGNGNNCPIKLLTGNTAPVVNAGLDYTIPKSTPFVLTGSGNDANGDLLTYTWDQMDVGGPGGNWNVPVGQAPLFRFFSPTTVPVRYFPKISDVINNTTTIGEILPGYGRTMNFRLSARDNRAGGGGLCWDQILLTVNGNAGPFLVKAPNTADSFTVGNFMHVKWDVAFTNIAPVNCDSVAIELSVDGGLTFPITLLAQTRNDGDEDVIVPNNPGTSARVRIRALKNVFYDMSDVNFSIKANTNSEFVFNQPQPATCNGVNPSVLLLSNGINGFTTPIVLSASGLPSGATIVFGGNPITPGSSVNIILQGTFLPGVYNVTITGTAGSVVKTKIIPFTILTTATAPVLSTPANNAVDLALTPTLSWQAVSDAITYNLLISSNSSFTDTVLSITNSTVTTYTVTTPLIQNKQYYWRVSSVNLCGVGSPSGVFQFKTVAINCSDTLRSTNVPVIIPTVVATVTSTLNVAAGGTIADVDVVGIMGTHTYVGDLIVTLLSPANTTCTLFSAICDDNQNFNISLDDEATTATVVCPPTAGQVVKPVQLLSRFDNQSSTGTWTLRVRDAGNEDGGALTGWGLRICTYASTGLPVNWLGFTAEKNADNTTVTAKWQTANEINNHHFELERSIDGRNFVMIGSITAGHNNSGIQTYLYNDLTPVTGTNYYRVKQVDNDGKFTYSPVAIVVFSKAGALWSIYPNPAKNKTTLYAKSNLNAVQVQLSDVSGKLLYNGYIPVLAAGQSVNIPLTNLAKGMYLLKIYSEKQTTTEKIMVQ